MTRSLRCSCKLYSSKPCLYDKTATPVPAIAKQVKVGRQNGLLGGNYPKDLIFVDVLVPVVEKTKILPASLSDEDAINVSDLEDNTCIQYLQNWSEAATSISASL